MSQRLLEVAELNSVLDQFGGSKALPASGKSVKFVRYAPFEEGQSSWNFGYTALVANLDWLGLVRALRPEEPLASLETRELTAMDRQALADMELF